MLITKKFPFLEGLQVTNFIKYNESGSKQISLQTTVKNNPNGLFAVNNIMSQVDRKQTHSYHLQVQRLHATIKNKKEG